MQKVTDLRDKLSNFQSRVENSEKALNKYQTNLQVIKQKKEEVNEFDIYELDSFYKKQQDFTNNLEIVLYKLSDMISQLKFRYRDGYCLLDVCESVFLRKQET